MIQKIGLTTINNRLAAIDAKVASNASAIERLNVQDEDFIALMTALTERANSIDSKLTAQIKAASQNAIELTALKTQLSLVHSDLLSQTKAILDKFKK